MRQKLIIDGTDLSSFAVWISGGGTYAGAVRDVQMVAVPGRSGDLIIDNGRFKNLTVKYPAFIMHDAQANVDGLRDFLSAHSTNYYKITDTYHPEQFRLGRYSGSFSPTMEKSLRAGSFDLVFDCCPERYLLSGENKQTLTASGSIINQTMFPSAPLIRVYGAGQLGVGSDTLTIKEHANAYVDIDSKIMDCYCGAVNCNSFVSLQSDSFPILPPGTTNINLGSGITKVEVTPRWYRI